MTRLVLTSMWVALMAVVSVSHAASMISVDVFPTEGLAGFSTFVVSATTDQAGIDGFDFTGAGGPESGLGFFGPMNQIDFFGQPTVFNNLNAAIDGSGGDSRQDSQFLFSQEDGLTLNAGESPTLLQAAKAQLGAGRTLPIARLVVADSDQVTYNGTITELLSTGGFANAPVEGLLTACCGPHPFPEWDPMAIDFGNVFSSQQMAGPLPAQLSNVGDGVLNILDVSIVNTVGPVPGTFFPTLHCRYARQAELWLEFPIEVEAVQFSIRRQ